MSDVSLTVAELYAILAVTIFLWGIVFYLTFKGR